MPKRKVKEVKRISYDECWENILRMKPKAPQMIPCAFTDWDNTPRHRLNGYVFDGVTPEKFKHYFARLVEKAQKEYTTDMIFVFAWNEWSEGGYLEPDELYKDGFLKAIKDVLS